MLTLRSITVICLLTVLFYSKIFADRTISGPFYNPGCADTCRNNLPYPSANNLVYFKSVGANDSLHFLISSINGLSILLIQTDIAGSINIDWPNYLNSNTDSNSISVVNGAVYDSIGVTLNKLYGYSDTSNTASIDAKDAVVPISFNDLLWETASLNNDTEITLINTSNDTMELQMFGNSGSLNISFQVFGSQGHYDVFPQLLHTDSSSQFEIALTNLRFIKNNNTRYALEMMVASQKSENRSLTIDRFTSIDDEYTPGTFDTCYISMPNSKTFVLWKPVCYMDGSRSLEKSTPLTYTAPIQITDSVSNLLDAFYGTGQYVSNSFNVSFGISGDSVFYNGYLVWTLEIGFGKIPVESFSTLVIALLVVCAAVPGLALLGGGSYGIYSKFVKKNKKPVEEIKEEIKDAEETVENSDNEKF